MSWARATATGVAIVAVAVVLLVYVPNLVLTKLHGSRSTAVTICVIVTSVALAAMLFALRRLQSRRMI